MASDNGWYTVKESHPIGPMSKSDLLRLLPEVGGEKALVYSPGMNEWIEASHLEELMASYRADYRPHQPKIRKSDDIDYKIFGDDNQFVEIVLDPKETLIAQPGTLMYMSSQIKAREHADTENPSLFLTSYTGSGMGREYVAIAAPYPSKIIALNLEEFHQAIICQRETFLCVARGSKTSSFFHKVFNPKFQYTLQKVAGDGILFLSAGGTIARRELARGETLELDARHLIAFEPQVNFEIEWKESLNIQNQIRGIPLVSLLGPGIAWLQSFPLSKLVVDVVQRTS